MNRKALILDIDGTLTNSQKEITPATLQALLQLQERGATVILASGRPMYGMKHISDALQLERFGGYILSFNGARITHMLTGEVICQKKLPTRTIAPLYDFAVAHDAGLVTYEGDRVVTGTRVDAYMEKEAALNHMRLLRVDDFPGYVTFDVNKCLLTAEPERAGELEQMLVSSFGGELSIYRSEPFFIEVMSQGVDKAKALEQLFSCIGLSAQETVACGDGFNDRSMILYAGVGVAMANAQDCVKKAADYVTEHSNDADGIVEVVQTFF